MNKIARILFIMVGCIFPIFIGTLHTITHFSNLVTPEINVFLQKKFIILGESQSLWNTWGIVSFMMGASFIVIGLLNVSMFRKLNKSESIPILAIIVMLIYQLCVTYVGFEFDQTFQLYGGIFGALLMVLSMVLTIKVTNDQL